MPDPTSYKGHRGGRGIVLDISQEIINAAVPRDSGHCIFADALRAAVPTARSISVDLQTMRFTDPETGNRYVYLTPARLQQALVDFDQGIPIEPFRIRLGRPAQIVRSKMKRPKATEAERKRMPIPEHGHATLAAPVANGAVPTKLGGKTPPIAALSNHKGRIRAFGLRQTSK